MCVFLISPVPIAEPLTSEFIDTPVFYNLAQRPIKYRVSVPIPTLHSAGVEGSEDAGARSKLLQPSQEEEALMFLLQHCVCVSRPCEILGDVNAEELKAVYPLHRCLVDGDGCVFSALFPVIHH